MTNPLEKKQHWLESWHVNPSLNKDYDVIDGLRGTAILMVVVDHVLYVNPNSPILFLAIHNIAIQGSSGVLLFFTLSGFLISWPFWKRKVGNAERTIPGGYAKRRFWKIYPPLALSIVILTVLDLTIFGDWSLVYQSLLWLIGLGFIFPVSLSINPVMWTLVLEIQFYTTLPLAFLLCKRASPKACLWILPLLYLIVPALLEWVIGPSGYLHRYLNLRFFNGFQPFAFGILIAGLDNLGLLRKKLAALGDIGLILLALNILAAGTFTTLYGSPDPVVTAKFNWIAVIACGLLVFYVTDPQHPRVKLLCKPSLRWVGIISYELYLVHQQIFIGMRGVIGQAGGNRLKYLATVSSTVLLSFLVAALFYRYFSLPILKYGRNQSSKSGS